PTAWTTQNFLPVDRDLPPAHVLVPISAPALSIASLSSIFTAKHGERVLLGLLKIEPSPTINAPSQALFFVLPRLILPPRLPLNPFITTLRFPRNFTVFSTSFETTPPLFSVALESLVSLRPEEGSEGRRT